MVQNTSSIPCHPSPLPVTHVFNEGAVGGDDVIQHPTANVKFIAFIGKKVNISPYPTPNQPATTKRKKITKGVIKKKKNAGRKETPRTVKNSRLILLNTIQAKTAYLEQTVVKH